MVQVVAWARQSLGLHVQKPIAITDVPNLLGVSEDCLEFSLDQVRGMTPAQALLEHRLNRLFAALTDEPHCRRGGAV